MILVKQNSRRGGMRLSSWNVDAHVDGFTKCSGVLEIGLENCGINEKEK
jgi:hypothetical protein